MNIVKEQTGTTLRLVIEGRLDTTTSGELEAEIKESLGGVDALVLDLAKLDYVSSAGLRVLLTAHKSMSAKKGVLRVVNVGPSVMEVFEMTGFATVLSIE